MNSNNRPSDKTLRQWFNENLKELQQATQLTYKLRTFIGEVSERVSYPSSITVETNLGALNIVNYMSHSYNDAMELIANPKVMITEIITDGTVLPTASSADQISVPVSPIKEAAKVPKYIDPK